MTRQTQAEVALWLKDNRFAEEPSGHHFFPSDREIYALDFTQPESSRGNAVLARRIAEACGSVGTLLLVNEWGVWPLEESRPLFDRAMQGYGDSRALGDAPGFLFGSDELDDLAGLVRWVLISGWSGAVLSKTSEFGFSFTDDEWVGMLGNSSESVHGWASEELLLNLGMRVLWEGQSY